MKSIKRIGILLLICILLFSALTLCVGAATETDGTEVSTTDASDQRLGDIKGSETDMADRIAYSLQSTATGLIMVFAVLALLALVVSLSKVIFYDLPRKARESAAAEARAEEEKEAAIMPQTAPVASVAPQTDDGELVAVITAAIAATIQSGELGSEFASGFRVVSFKRVNTNTWNKR